MALSYLSNAICAKVLLRGLDERLLMLIPLSVPRRLQQEGSSLSEKKIRSHPAAASPLVFPVER